MPRHPEPVRPKEPDLTPRQAGDTLRMAAVMATLRMAAVMANTNAAVLSLLLNEDPEFQGLVEDCKGIHQLPCEEWRARAEAFARDAAERAMVDGRVSTLNLCLKATGLLAGTAEDAAGDDPLQAWMDGLSDEEWAEHEALDADLEEPVPATTAPLSAEAAAQPASESLGERPPTLTDVVQPPADDLPPLPEPIATMEPASAAALAPRPASLPERMAAATRLDRAGLQAAFSHHRPPFRLDRGPGGLPPSTAGP
jgi:hypothetical protein